MNFYLNGKLFCKFSYSIPVSVFMISRNVSGATLSSCDPFHHKPSEEIVLCVFECSCDLGSHKRLPAHPFKKIIRDFHGLMVLFFHNRGDSEAYRKKCTGYFIQFFNMTVNIMHHSRLILVYMYRSTNDQHHRKREKVAFLMHPRLSRHDRHFPKYLP